MTRPRFSLRLLIVLVTAIAMLLGYGQHRRRQIHTACQELRDYGYACSTPSAWHDRLWQRQPTTDVTFYKQNEELLIMDLQNATGDPKPIANLVAIGVPETGLREFARRLAQAERERSETLARKYEEYLRRQMESMSQQPR
jgi:hypothetical protein